MRDRYERRQPTAAAPHHRERRYRCSITYVKYRSVLFCRTTITISYVTTITSFSRCIAYVEEVDQYWVGQPTARGRIVPIPPTMDELLDDLRSKIKDGTYPPGTQLPSGRALADSYDVSHSTIQRAIATLREQGVLVGRPGRGVFVAESSRR